MLTIVSHNLLIDYMNDDLSKREKRLVDDALSDKRVTNSALKGLCMANKRLKSAMRNNGEQPDGWEH